MAKMTGAHIFMESLLAEGVTCIFGNPGTSEVGIMDALQDYPQIRYYLALHESQAVAMAAGYARATGSPGVVNVHISPGTANAIGMLHNAYASNVPLVVTAGQQYSTLLPQEPLLAVDLMSWVRPITKWAAQVDRPADLPMMLRRAFKVAMTPPTGPVYVAIPVDVQAAEADVTIGPAQRLHYRLSPDPEAVAQARPLLLEAERPVIVVGDGVAQSAAMPEAVRVAELLGAEVYTHSAAELNFPTNHPLFRGPLNNLNGDVLQRQLASADVILAVGTRMFTLLFPAPEPLLPPETKVIHLDADPWQIGKNLPVSVGLWGDPRAGLRALVEALEPDLSPVVRERAERQIAAGRQERARRRGQADEAAVLTRDADHISDAFLFKTLRDLLPENAVFCDCLLSSSARNRLDYLEFTEPGSFFRLPNGGYLGWALGGALGAKLACPDRPVVAFIGDGELMYGVQGLWSAVHYDIPVTCLIYNNRGYDAVKGHMKTFLRSIGKPDRQSQFVGMSIDQPPLDCAKIAEAFGVWGARVDRPRDLNGVLREAFSLGRPAVVDVVVPDLAVRNAAPVAVAVR